VRRRAVVVAPVSDADQVRLTGGWYAVFGKSRCDFPCFAKKDEVAARCFQGFEYRLRVWIFQFEAVHTASGSIRNHGGVGEGSCRARPFLQGFQTLSGDARKSDQLRDISRGVAKLDKDRFRRSGGIVFHKASSLLLLLLLR